VREAAEHPGLVAVMTTSARPGLLAEPGQPGRRRLSGRPAGQGVRLQTRIGWHSDWQAAPKPGHLAGHGVHLPPRRHQPGQRIPAGGAGQPPLGHPGALPQRQPGRGAGRRPPDRWLRRHPRHRRRCRWDSRRSPARFPVYAERGDVLLHDAYLWHSAARATDDVTTRRHVRGGYLNAIRTATASARSSSERRSMTHLEWPATRSAGTVFAVTVLPPVGRPFPDAHSRPLH